jgi:hypothetical protein
VVITHDEQVQRCFPSNPLLLRLGSCCTSEQASSGRPAPAKRDPAPTPTHPHTSIQPRPCAPQFARLIGTREHAEYMWRITKDERQHSHIAQEDIME